VPVQILHEIIKKSSMKTRVFIIGGSSDIGKEKADNLLADNAQFPW